MPTPIATDIEGRHPYFLGVDEPQDFASSARWTVLAENNPRKAILQAKFGEGRVLTMRVSAQSAPKTVGSKASFAHSPVAEAQWLSHKEHVKLLVTYSDAPASRTFSVDCTASGVALLADGKGGIDILAGATKVGALPRPWFEYNVGGDTEKRTRVFLDWSAGLGSLSITMPELTAVEWQGAVLDPTVITTSTASTATAYSNQRKIDRTSNGVLWAMFWDGTSGTGTPMRFRYSTDDGATWTDGGGFGFSGSGSTYTPNGSFFIDADDYAHVVYKDRSSGGLHYRRGTPNAGRTAWTWSAYTVLTTNTGIDYPDLIAFPEGTGWAVKTVTASGTAGQVNQYPLTVAADGTVSTGSATIVGSGYSGSAAAYPSIDFNHTGDGKTVKDGTPHLYAAWSAGATGAGKGVRFKKATYSGGSWTWGTEREIDSTRYINAANRWLNCMFDGTRVVIPGFIDDGTNWDLVVYERDAADTTTTTRVLLDNAAIADHLYAGSSSYDSSGNLYLFGRVHDGTTYRTGYREWTRATNTLSAVVPIAGSTPPGGGAYVSAKRGYSGNKIEFIYTDGTASPYSVTYDSISLAQSVAVNPVVETDTAQSITRVKKRAIIYATETDSGVAVARIKTRAVGTAGETDVANTISKGVRIPMSYATEADTAVSVGIKFTPVYYTFIPPTVHESVSGDRLFSRYSVPVGQTVIKVDGVYTTSPYPWLGDLEGLTDGVDYFLGGHVYTVDNTVALELQGDGYTVERAS